MGMTKDERAAYQRQYRARKRLLGIHQSENDATAHKLIGGANDELLKINQQLMDEIRHLKAELARRRPVEPFTMRTEPDADTAKFVRGGFNSRPFTPAPKKGK